MRICTASTCALSVERERMKGNDILYRKMCEINSKNFVFKRLPPEKNNALKIRLMISDHSKVGQIFRAGKFILVMANNWLSVCCLLREHNCGKRVSLALCARDKDNGQHISVHAKQLIRNVCI